MNCVFAVEEYDDMIIGDLGLFTEHFMHMCLSLRKQQITRINLFLKIFDENSFFF